MLAGLFRSREFYQLHIYNQPVSKLNSLLYLLSAKFNCQFYISGHVCIGSVPHCVQAYAYVTDINYILRTHCRRRRRRRRRRRHRRIIIRYFSIGVRDRMSGGSPCDTAGPIGYLAPPRRSLILRCAGSHTRNVVRAYFFCVRFGWCYGRLAEAVAQHTQHGPQCCARAECVCGTCDARRCVALRGTTALLHFIGSTISRVVRRVSVINDLPLSRYPLKIGAFGRYESFFFAQCFKRQR